MLTQDTLETLSQERFPMDAMEKLDLHPLTGVRKPTSQQYC